MPNEMLTRLRAYVNEHPDSSKDFSVIDRLLSSNFIGNKDSHDSSFNVTIGDCKAFWADVMELERQYCNHIVR